MYMQTTCICLPDVKRHFISLIWYVNFVVKIVLSKFLGFEI